MTFSFRSRGNAYQGYHVALRENLQSRFDGPHQKQFPLAAGAF
jgi:hypothetical protein